MRRLAPDAATGVGIIDRLPLRRFGTIAEIANAACYLAGPAARYVNGAILDVDGETMLGAGDLV